MAFLHGFQKLFSGIFKGLKNPEFQALLALVILIVLSGTIFYHRVEGWSFLDALYFSVTTLSTIGYGDFSPETDAGKIFTMLYIFVGIGIIFGFFHVIAKLIQRENPMRGFLRQHSQRNEPKQPEEK